MDSSRIEELLNKYWNCETSLEEEQQLREFFQGKNIPEHLRETAGLFQYFESQKKKSLDDIAFDPQSTTRTKQGKSRSINIIYNAMRIAAGVAVLMIAIWFVRNEIRDTNTAQVEDTYEDPKLAFEETKKALLIISKSFQSAETNAKKINLFNEAQQEISRKNKEVKL